MEGGGAYKALELAVFDAVGKARGKRVVDLLGGPVRERVEVDWWSGRRSPQDLARWAREGRAQGFHGMKIKCKLEDPMVERMEAVKAAVPDMPVTVDPNTRFYTRAAAADLARRLGAVGNVAVFEDPIPKEDFDEYARLRQEMQGTGHPPGAAPGPGGRPAPGDRRGVHRRGQRQPSEHGHLRGDGRHGRGGGDPLLARLGERLRADGPGLRPRLRRAPSCTLPSDIMGNRLHVEHFLTEPIAFDGGWALLPAGPGLGGELDLAAVERQLIRRGEVSL